MALKFELPNLIGNAGKVLIVDPTESYVLWVIGGGSTYTLPIASPTILGGIKVGANLSIDGAGVLSASNQITVSATAPSNPVLNQLWVDIN